MTGAQQTFAHKAMVAALEEAAEYFNDRSDVVDGDYGQPAPNKEMRLLTEINAVLALAKS